MCFENLQFKVFIFYFNPGKVNLEIFDSHSSQYKESSGM
jgi:hypothetical protein